MREIKLNGLDISAYNETLDNGLEVFLLPYENKKNYYITYATRFGSDVNSYNIDNKKINLPNGVAHFLEHKLFEEESGIDPFSFFQESGSDCNASTSYDNTQYICSGNKKFRENLRFLIKFVNNPYFTDENVEKEKGIIAEEIKMYDDLPDCKLENKLRECVYKNSNRRVDIAGTIDSINKITKKDLYNAYKAFYKPNNMFILILGNFKIRDALEVIKEELRHNKNVDEVEINKIEEVNDVFRKKFVFKDNVEVSEIGIGLKIDVKDYEIDDIELDLYLNMLTSILFGSSSLFRENTRNKKILSGIYMTWESYDYFRVFYLMASTIDPDELVKEIKDTFDNISITEDNFERIKKVWIANEVKIIDNIDRAESNLFDDIINYRRIIPNKLDLIRNMKLSKLNKIIEKIDFNNISVVEMLSKKD